MRTVMQKASGSPKPENYASLIEIDPDALDVEWVEQPGVFLHVAESLARARNKLERAEQDYEVKEARIASKIRAEANGDRKVTEAAVKERLTQNSILAEAREELADLRLKVELLAAGVRALDMRKSALENLVRLQGQSYFAGPKEPRALSVEVAKRRLSDDTKEKIRTKGGCRE